MTPLSNISWPYMQGYILHALNSFSLVPVFLHMYHTVFITITLLFKIKKCNDSSFILIYKHYFGYMWCFAVPWKLQNIFLLLKKCHWNLNKDYTYQFGHFNSIGSSNLWTWDIFPFISDFFSFFHQSLLILSVEIWLNISLSIYCFDGITNRIIFFISSLDPLLLVYKNAIDFRVLIFQFCWIQWLDLTFLVYPTISFFLFKL